jgi:hypothetical protein
VLSRSQYITGLGERNSYPTRFARSEKKRHIRPRSNSSKARKSFNSSVSLKKKRPVSNKSLNSNYVKPVVSPSEFVSDVGLDGQLVDLDLLRAKLTSANLRISGQLQTIRSLEVQLGEANIALKQNKATISESRLRIQALERREKNSYLRGSAHEEITDHAASSNTRGLCVPQQIIERDAIRKLKVHPRIYR